MNKIIVYTSIFIIVLSLASLVAHAYTYTHIPNTVYYSVVLVRVPSTYPLNLSDPGKLYVLSSQPGYRALVKVEPDTKNISFPDIYPPNNILPQDIKKLIRDVFLQLLAPSKGEESKIDIYYLNNSSDIELYVCDRARVSIGLNYQVAYDSVPLKGVVENRVSGGYKIVLAFSVLQSSGELCGRPIHKEGLKVATIIVGIALIVLAIRSYVKYR